MLRRHIRRLPRNTAPLRPYTPQAALSTLRALHSTLRQEIQPHQCTRRHHLNTAQALRSTAPVLPTTHLHLLIRQTTIRTTTVRDLFLLLRMLFLLFIVQIFKSTLFFSFTCFSCGIYLKTYNSENVDHFLKMICCGFQSISSPVVCTCK
ncbi:hypothetical protein OSTOST_05808 [Ostertagia ostertagi]